MPCDDFCKSNKTSETVLNHQQDKYTLDKLPLVSKSFFK